MLLLLVLLLLLLLVLLVLLLLLLLLLLLVLLLLLLLLLLLPLLPLLPPLPPPPLLPVCVLPLLAPAPALPPPAPAPAPRADPVGASSSSSSLEELCRKCRIRWLGDPVGVPPGVLRGDTSDQCDEYRDISRRSRPLVALRGSFALTAFSGVMLHLLARALPSINSEGLRKAPLHTPELGPALYISSRRRSSPRLAS